jgi:hypothetical protein
MTSTEGSRSYVFRIEIEITDGTDLSEGELALSVMDGLFGLDEEGTLFSEIVDPQHKSRLIGLTLAPLEGSGGASDGRSPG